MKKAIRLLMLLISSFLLVEASDQASKKLRAQEENAQQKNAQLELERACRSDSSEEASDSNGNDDNRHKKAKNGYEAFIVPPLPDEFRDAANVIISVTEAEIANCGYKQAPIGRRNVYDSL